METAISTSILFGAEALRFLNQVLNDRDTAKGWYGVYYGQFTQFNILKLLWPLNPSRKISKVFRLNSDDWQFAIAQCLNNNSVWIYYATESKESRGECSWLPLYRALPEVNKKQTTIPARKSASSIAAVKSLPAARLDAWGLVVLALANGAIPEVRYGSNGGYFAELAGRTFVVTMWQPDISGPITGHIEPRQACSEQFTVMDTSEWENLLRSGHSFSEPHHIFGWPLNGNPVSEPPEDLVTGRRDHQLKRLVMDNQRTKQLQEQLRTALYQCHDYWEALEGSAGMEIHAEKIKTIKHHLRSFKLILVNGVSPSEASSILEVREADIIHYATKQLDFANDIAARNINNIDGENLLQRQKIVVALIRLLVSPQKVDQVLSTRNTGTYVSII